MNLRKSRTAAVAIGLFAGLLGGGPVSAQFLYSGWPVRDAGPIDAADSRFMMAVDTGYNFGAVWITGQSEVDTNLTAITTWMYNPDGTTAENWPQTWLPDDPSGTNYGAIALNTGSSVYVVGAYTIEGWGRDSVVLKYGEDGTLDAHFPAAFDTSGQSGENYPIAAVMHDGYLFIACASLGVHGLDYLIWVVDDFDGSTAATARFDYASSTDFPTDIESTTLIFSGEGGGSLVPVVMVTGRSYDSSTHYDIQTLKYYFIGGDTLVDATDQLPNHGRYGASSTSNDYGTSLAFFESYNHPSSGEIDIYVSGYTKPYSGGNYDYLVLGYMWNQTNEEYDLWTVQPNGTENGDDFTGKIMVSSDNTSEQESRVVVTGYSWGGTATNFDAWTLSYSRTGSDLRDWRDTYSGDDRAVDMIGVSPNDIYVLSRANNGSNFDYRLARLDSGSATWHLGGGWTVPLTYNNGFNDSPACVRLNFNDPEDPSSLDAPDMYVTGRNYSILEASPKYATLRYGQ